MIQDYSGIAQIGTVDGTTIFESYGLEKSLAEFDAQGIELLDCQTMARMRVANGQDHVISKRETFVREQLMYLPAGVTGEEVFLLGRKGFDLKALTRKRGHSLQKYLLRILEGADDSNSDYFIVENDSAVVTSGDSFASDPKTKFLFGDYAAKQGEFLKSVGISYMPFYFKNWISESGCSGPFVVPLKILGAQEASAIFRSDYNIKGISSADMTEKLRLDSERCFGIKKS